MKTLNDKIKAALAGHGLSDQSDDKESGYAFLTAKELNALVRMRRARHICMAGGVKRFEEDDGDSYFPSYGSITLTKRQAKEVAEDFSRWDEKNGKPLLAQVYLSDWSHHSPPNGLYIAI